MAEEKKPTPKQNKKALETKKELQPEIKQSQIQVKAESQIAKKKTVATKSKTRDLQDDGSLKKGDIVKTPVGLCTILSVEKDLVIVAKDNNPKVKYSIDINKAKKEK